MIGLGDKLKVWKDRPDIFVKEVFGITPDAWQLDVLMAVPHHQRLAMKACKGPGKTALLAWVCWWFMFTRPNPKIAVTSITGANLADGLWSELSKFAQKSKLIQSLFTITKTRIFLNTAPETWWISARIWSKTASSDEQGATLAGLHADYIMFCLDEVGSMPLAVLAAAEAALSSCKEGKLVVAGNPNSLDGLLYTVCTRDRALWHITEISSDPDDPKRTPRVSKIWAQEMITAFGRENPYVLVNIFGQFAPSSFNALIGRAEVEEAMRKNYRESEYSGSAKILGMDVARQGSDATVIFPRQGLQAFTPLKYRNIDGTTGAGLVARKWQDWGAEACFIDDTGGFGASTLDNLIRLGFAPIGIHFSEKSSNSRYVNKRTEMIFDCVEWIKRGGALPNIPELLSALVDTTYTFKGDKLAIEPKEMIKARLGYSPDDMDALALTFAQPVIKNAVQPVKGSHVASYEPCGRARALADMGGKGYSDHVSAYDPFNRKNW